MAGDPIQDPELARRLVLHEARAQQTPARELRDLGDGWLFHDPNDPEPFWNRVIAPIWPSEHAAFDRRLDEMIMLFATLGRLPHVRPLPVGGAPADLAGRLVRAGFETLGADRRMVLAEPGQVAERINAAEARVAAAFGEAAVRVSRQAIDGEDRRAPSPTPTRTPAPAATPEPARTPRLRASRLTSGRRGWQERRYWAAEASLVLVDAFGVE